MIGSYMEALTKRCRAVPEKGDFERDGVLYCGKCRTPKECRVALGGTMRIVGCVCDCRNQRYKEDLERQRMEDERLRVDSLRLTGISDRGLRDCRFENAISCPLIEKCRRYAERWDDARSENVGILLWGGPGGGKTYAAACIANHLIDRGVPAMITSFPRILAAGFEERQELLRRIGRFPLLVLDDLGAERGTEMALETVFAVIDERYKSGKPLIATTNLTLEEIKDPADVAHRRIYDRVLEMCTPVLVQEADYRKNEASRKMLVAREIFYDSQD